jgi:predicted RND superfamily exporter protein
MEKIIKLFVIYLFAFYILTTTTDVIALESTASAATPTPTTEKKIKELKDRLASRVAELNVISQKMIKGEIKTISDSKIILISNGNEININLNDESSFFLFQNTGVKKPIKVDSLKTGQAAISWGAFNSSTSTLSSKTFVVVETPLLITGTIRSVDKKNYQLVVQTTEKEYLIDHDVTTKNYMLAKDDVLAKSGFSKYQEGQTVYVAGDLVTDKNGKDMLLAQRIIILKNTAQEPQNPSPTPTPTGQKNKI